MGCYFPMAILKSALDHQIVDVALDSYICEEHFNALYFKPYSPKRSVMLKLFIENREETRVLGTGGIAARNMVICVYARVGF